MNERRAIRTLDLRKAVPEWAALGLDVKISPDGTVEVRAEGIKKSDGPDLIDWRRPK